MDVNEINELYENSNLDKSSFHYERGLIIPLCSFWKNIAVNVSGGADSALLVLTLAKIIKEKNFNCKIHFISFVRYWETKPWAPFISQEVYNKIKSMFPDIIENRIESFIPTELEEYYSGRNLYKGESGDRIIVNAFNKFVNYKYKFDAVYNATTLNPKDKNIGIVNGVNKRPIDREIEFFNNLYSVYNKDENFLFFHPFRYIDKRYVIEGYYKNNWIEVLNITRSCEGDKNTNPTLFQSYLEYNHKISKLPVCSKCFWCKEREWAIKEILVNNNYE